MEVEFDFVDFGAIAEPTPGKLFLDVGNACRPGVIDHHFKERQGDHFECATSLLVNDTELLTKWLRDEDWSGPFEIVMHKYPDFDCIASSFAALRLLEAGGRTPEDWDTWAIALSDAACRVDRGQTTITFADPIPATPYLLSLVLEEIAEKRNRKGKDAWGWQVREGHRVLRRAVELLRLTPGIPLEQIDLRGKMEGIEEAIAILDRTLDAFQRDYNRLGTEKPPREPDSLDGVEEICLLDRKDPSKTHSGHIAYIHEPECRGGFFKSLIRGAYHDRIQAVCVFTDVKADDETGASRWTRAVVSVDPELEFSLRGLGRHLDLIETARRREVGLPRTGPPRPGYDNSDPWYDGRSHDYTIIDAPRRGTTLTPNQVKEAIADCKRWHLLRDEDVVAQAVVHLGQPLLVPEERIGAARALLACVTGAGKEQSEQRERIAREAQDILSLYLGEEDLEVLREGLDRIKSTPLVLDFLNSVEPSVRACALARLASGKDLEPDPLLYLADLRERTGIAAHQRTRDIVEFLRNCSGAGISERDWEAFGCSTNDQACRRMLDTVRAANLLQQGQEQVLADILVRLLPSALNSAALQSDALRTWIALSSGSLRSSSGHDLLAGRFREAAALALGAIKSKEPRTLRALSHDLAYSVARGVLEDLSIDERLSSREKDAASELLRADELEEKSERPDSLLEWSNALRLLSGGAISFAEDDRLDRPRRAFIEEFGEGLRKGDLPTALLQLDRLAESRRREWQDALTPPPGMKRDDLESCREKAFGEYRGLLQESMDKVFEHLQTVGSSGQRVPGELVPLLDHIFWLAMRLLGEETCISLAIKRDALSKLSLSSQARIIGKLLSRQAFSREVNASDLKGEGNKLRQPSPADIASLFSPGTRAETTLSALMRLALVRREEIDSPMRVAAGLLFRPKETGEALNLEELARTYAVLRRFGSQREGTCFMVPVLLQFALPLLPEVPGLSSDTGRGKEGIAHKSWPRHTQKLALSVLKTSWPPSGKEEIGAPYGLQELARLLRSELYHHLPMENPLFQGLYQACQQADFLLRARRLLVRANQMEFQFLAELVDWVMDLSKNDDRTKLDEMMAKIGDLHSEADIQDPHSVPALMNWVGRQFEDTAEALEDPDSDHFVGSDQVKKALNRLGEKNRVPPHSPLAPICRETFLAVQFYLQQKQEVLRSLDASLSSSVPSCQRDGFARGILESSTFAWILGDYAWVEEGEALGELLPIQEGLVALCDEDQSEKDASVIISPTEKEKLLSKIRFAIGHHLGKPGRADKSQGRGRRNNPDRLGSISVLLEKAAPSKSRVDLLPATTRLYQRLKNLLQMEPGLVDRVYFQLTDAMVRRYELAWARRRIDEFSLSPIGWALGFWLSGWSILVPIGFMGLFWWDGAEQIPEFGSIGVVALLAITLALAVAALFQLPVARTWRWSRGDKAEPPGGDTLGQNQVDSKHRGYAGSIESTSKPVDALLQKRLRLLESLKLKLFLPQFLVPVVVGVYAVSLTHEVALKVASSIDGWRLAFLLTGFLGISYWALKQLIRKEGGVGSFRQTLSATSRVFTYSFLAAFAVSLVIAPVIQEGLSPNVVLGLRSEVRVPSIHPIVNLLCFFPRHLLFYATLGMFVGIFLKGILRAAPEE